MATEIDNSLELYHSVEELKEFTDAGLKCVPVPNLPGLTICYGFAGDGIDISAKFGSVTLSKIHISKDGACHEISAKQAGFTLKLNTCFNLNPNRHLTIKGQGCAPVYGCKNVNQQFSL